MKINEDDQITGILSPFLERNRNSKVAKIIKDGSHILDLGCGRASLLHALLKLGKKNIFYIGVDSIIHIIEENKKKFPGYKFIQIDLLKDDITPSISERFNIITMIALLEHLPNPEELFLKLSYFLTEKGQIIVTTPRKGTELIYKIGSLLGLFSKEAQKEHRFTFPDRKYLQKLADMSGYSLKLYRTFLFGFNQLAVFIQNQDY